MEYPAKPISSGSVNTCVASFRCPETETPNWLESGSNLYRYFRGSGVQLSLTRTETLTSSLTAVFLFSQVFHTVTRQTFMVSPLTPVWFIVIDHDFTCVLKGANCVDVPSDGIVYHSLKEIKALDWDTLKDTSGDLNVWKLWTPVPSTDGNQEYLAKLKHLEILEEGEEDKKQDGKAMVKPKEAEGEVACLLKPDDKISLHFKELSQLEPRIHILVQVPAKPGGTSCCVLSTTCQLIQLQMYSKTNSNS